MSKKNIYDLSTDELIDLLKSSDKPIPIENEVTEAAKFIYALNIRHGDAKISAQLIYFTYKQWKGWDKRPQPKPLFFRDFSRQFESIRTKEGISYLLDPKPFDLSREQYFLSRKDLREQRAKQKKKESPQSNKTSKSEETI